MPTTKTMPCPRCGAPTTLLDAVSTGAHWRSERTKLGLTQQAVADAMDCSKAYVSALELGERPWTQNLVTQFARALDGATASKQRGA